MTVLLELHIKDQTSETYYVRQITDSTTDVITTEHTDDQGNPLHDDGGTALPNDYTIPQSSVLSVLQALALHINPDGGTTYTIADIVGIDILNHSIRLRNDSLSDPAGVFEGSTNLQTLVIRTSKLILDSNVFLNAGVNENEPGVTIVYKTDTSDHTYDDTAFNSAEIRAFIIYQNNITISNLQLETAQFPKVLVGENETPDLFFGSVYPDGRTSQVPVTVSSVTPSLCFAVGTMIKTDQGDIAIEEVTTSNTIRGMSVCRIIKRLSNNNVVLIKKDAFGVNRPNKDTLSTTHHGIYVNNSDDKFTRLFNLFDNKKVIKLPHKVEYVYNIGVKGKHSYMFANNLKVETLRPGF